jgi:hypothetical protein
MRPTKPVPEADRPDSEEEIEERDDAVGEFGLPERLAQHEPHEEGQRHDDADDEHVVEIEAAAGRGRWR